MVKRLQNGSLLIECIVALSVFSLGFYGLLSLYRDIEEVSTLNLLRSEALRIAENELDQGFRLIKEDFDTNALPAFASSTVYEIQNTIIIESEASKVIKSKVAFTSYNKKHEVELNIRVTDPTRALGLSTCSDYFSNTDFSIKSSFDFDVSGFNLSERNQPTDIDVVGNYAYITFDSGIATDTDFAIFDFADKEHPSLISKLDTGPGLSAIHVVGKTAFVTNRSINAQLQVIDLSNIMSPHLVQNLKLPGVYKSGTTLGKKIWYGRKMVYVGADKSDAEEVYIYDATNPQNLIFKSSFEIGAGVNDLVSFNHDLFVANPTDTELTVVDVSNPELPLLKDTFNAPRGTGNGKSLAVIGSNLVLGRTVGNRELYLLDTSSQIKELSNFDRSASVDGLILKTDTLFSITPETTDMFQIFSISSSTIKKVASPKIIFPTRPISFDCDASNFFVLSGRSLYILSP